ncbi:hypothetical protein EON78_03620, partial [bacterium]
YKDLSWSPDGKTMALSVYKPGNGGNLALMNIENSELKYITDDNVMFANTDPSWSPDSKKIYYSSDRNDISNLYSYDLENNLTERLSNSYSGIEFPYVRNNYIYFTSYFAKGTDIKRARLNKLEKFQISKTEPKVDTEKPIVDLGKYEPKKYVPWLSPDLILPITGVDERGDQIGIQGSLDDILQQHALSASVAYGLLSSRFSYGVSYVNRMFDPLIGVQLSEFPSIAATRDGKSYYFQRAQGLNFIVSRPFFNELSQQISNIGTLELSFNNLNPLSETIAQDTDQSLIRTGLNNFIAFNFRSQEITGGGSTADIHPTNGYRFDFRVENASRFLFSKYEYIQVLADVRRYLPLWFNHALALRASLEVTTGNTTPLLLGGPPVNLNLGIQNFVPLRGFNIAQFVGDRLGLASVEYRFPILTRINTVFSGLYIDSVYGAAFLDAGDAWFSDQRQPRLNLGGGAELRARVAVGNRSTLGAYIGLARKITYQQGENTDNQFYFGFANSF